MAANTDQEIAPLNENNDQSKYLVIDIPEDDFVPGPECCIYEVPSRFRETNKKAFTPQMISIGPIHHGNPNLARMERQKWRYYKKFGQRTSEETLKEFQRYIKEHVSDIRRCYDIQFVFDTESEVSNFEQMILFDAVFIIELFLRNFENEFKDCNDDEEDNYYNYLNQSALLRVKFLTDFTLLENQLPFFVLEDLYKLAFLVSYKPPFLDLACLYFGIKKDPLFEEKKIKHFTDLIRYQVLRAYPLNTDILVGKHNMHSATQLHEAGVKFKCSEINKGFGVMFNGVSYNCFKIGGLEFEGFEFVDIVKDDVLECATYSLLQVQFEEGVLELLTIDVEYETEIRFRNLMAFEQYYYPKKAYFCSYIKLLDSLIDTSEDVDLLVKERIIVNKLGSSEAVAKMINNLAVGVVHSTLLYGKIGMKLGRYYKKSWRHRCPTLDQVYFKDCWRGTATVGAFIVVMLTVIQTVLAILEKAMPTK